MNQRILLIIAAALTAFILVLVGGLANRLSSGTAPTPTAGVAELSTAVPSGTLDPTVEALIREREAAYQQALAEANSRLDQANQQLVEATQPPLAVPAAIPVVTPVIYAVTAEQAQTLALTRVPGATLMSPVAVVSYQGVPAYEVILDQGTLYIDAQSAAVLADGTVLPTGVPGGQISAEQAAEVALAYHGSGTVRTTELERERGVLVYEVKLNDGSEIYVDATTGQVVYAKIKNQDRGEDTTDDDDGDDDDDRDDEMDDDDE